MATWLLHLLIFLSGGIVFLTAFILIICFIADKLQMDGTDTYFNYSKKEKKKNGR